MTETPSDKASVKFGVEGSANDYSATLVGDIRRALSSYFGGDLKVLKVKIRRVEEDRIDGFLKVRSAEKHENFLPDFQATSTSQGTLSSLEVDGKKIDIPSSRSKRVT